MQVEPNVNVDVEASLQLPLEVLEEDHQQFHKFHLLLGMMERTTILQLHVENLIDRDVLFARLKQLFTVLNVMYTYAASLGETALYHSMMKIMIQLHHNHQMLNQLHHNNHQMIIQIHHQH